MNTIIRNLLFFTMMVCAANLVAGTCYEIAESTDWVSEISANIADGDTIMLITDGGRYYSADEVVLPAVELVLMAKPGLTNKPVLSCGSAGTLVKANANITIKGIAFNGLWAEQGDNGPYRLLRVYSAFQKMVVEECDFFNGRAYGIVSNSPILDSLVVDKCNFFTMDKISIYFKEAAGLVNYARITNSSFWDIDDIGIYIYQAADSVVIAHNTFYGLTNINAYLKECVVGNVVRDNIFMSDSAMAIKIYGDSPVVEYNCFYNNSTDIEYVGSADLTFETGNIYVNPEFENADSAKFALAANSFCVGSASDGANMGDTRWGTYTVGSDSVNILFNVSVPGYTPETDTIFIAGSVNDWDSCGYAMTKVSDTLWQYILKSAPNTDIEYKYTRGSWLSVEKDSAGGEIENRVINVGMTSLIVDDIVGSWRDISLPTEPQNIAPILSYYNSSPQTSIAVTWASDSLSESVIWYGIQDVRENQLTVENYEDLFDEGDSLIHIAYLSGLTPNTTYKYKVETQGVYTSDELSFTTADNSNEFEFVVGGDNQLGLVFSVLDSIVAEDPDFMLHTGDMVVDGTNVGEWYTFTGRFEELNGNYAMMPVYGNHEEDSPMLHKLFQLPNNNSSDPDDEGHWFSFDYNNVHFIGIDVYRDYSVGSAQYTWLVNDFESINSDIDHIIVYFHHPIYSNTGSHGPNLIIRQTLEPLFIQYGVDLVFCGHNHWYERSRANGITYITTGGLGEYLKDFDDLSSNEWSVYIEKVNHYTRVTINGEDLKVEMIRANGTVGDCFENLKVDGSDSDLRNLGEEPVLDTDSLQTDSELRLDRLYITEDDSTFYFGFDAPAMSKGISYGLYIDVDNIAGSGGNSDRWGKAVSAVSQHLPEIQIYAFHNNDDTWSSSSPKYYSWDAGASDWVSGSGGMGSLPEGGTFAVNSTNRFFELSIPKSSPGFNGSDSFFVELFTVGETEGAGASESIPSDSSIQFTSENTLTDVTVLSNFYGYNITEPAELDTNTIQTDGNPADWIELGVEPLAIDTDNAQNSTQYKMDSLFVHMDSVNVYFGFMTPVESLGLHFGIYIDTDSIVNSGGTSDKWGASVTAVNKHLPDIAIYAYHGETGAWSGSSPKYYIWNGSAWEQNEDMSGDGSLPPGGIFAHNVNHHFTEIMVPRSSIGFEGVNSFYISLFNFGSEKFICETVPTDTSVNMMGENTSKTIEITNFAYYDYENTNPGTSIDNKSSVAPINYKLYQNYPNPFNPTTTIEFKLPIFSNVKIVVYNALGQKLQTIINKKMPAGFHKINFDGSNLSSGLYFYKITVGHFQQVNKMILIR